MLVLSLVAAFLLFTGVVGLLQLPISNPVGMYGAMVRSGAWQSIGLGVVLVLAVAVILRRLAHDTARYAKTGMMREEVLNLSPRDFEMWCAARLRDQGFRVTEVGGQGDHGVDLIAEKGVERVVVQCKRWLGAGYVGEPQVRDLYGAMHHASATGAMLITTGGFSEPALAWAQGKPIRLWDVDRLIRGAPVSAIQPTQSAAPVATTCPRCGSGSLGQKVNRKTQEPFLACSRFPNCRYTQEIATAV